MTREQEFSPCFSTRENGHERVLLQRFLGKATQAAICAENREEIQEIRTGVELRLEDEYASFKDQKKAFVQRSRAGHMVATAIFNTTALVEISEQIVQKPNILEGNKYGYIQDTVVGAMETMLEKLDDPDPCQDEAWRWYQDTYETQITSAQWWQSIPGMKNIPERWRSRSPTGQLKYNFNDNMEGVLRDLFIANAVRLCIDNDGELPEREELTNSAKEGQDHWAAIASVNTWTSHGIRRGREKREQLWQFVRDHGQLPDWAPLWRDALKAYVEDPAIQQPFAGCDTTSPLLHRSPQNLHPSLTSNGWRSPAHCAGYVSTHARTTKERQVVRQACDLLEVPVDSHGGVKAARFIVGLELQHADRYLYKDEICRQGMERLAKYVCRNYTKEQ